MPILHNKKRPSGKRSPTKFVQGGFEFKLVRRDGRIALLEKSKPASSYKSIEVVILQPAVEKTVNGSLVFFEESLPPTTAWGSLGWTFHDPDLAHRKFEKLVKRELEPKKKRQKQ